MAQVRLSREAERTLQKIIAIWPQIMHQQRKEKIFTMLSLLMGARKVRIADQALVIEAVKLIVPKSYDPFFHMMENMEKFKRLTLDPFDDMQAYAALPIKVKRWKYPRRSHQKATAKKKIKVTSPSFCSIILSQN